MLQSPALNQSNSRRSISSPKVEVGLSRTFHNRDHQQTGSSLASVGPYMNLEQDYSLSSDIEREL